MDTEDAAPEIETVETPAVEPAKDEPYNPEDFYADDKPKDAPVEAPEGEEGEQEEAEEQEAKPAVEAPLSWAKDAKEVFGKLPPEAQEIIVARERDREAAVQSKFREAANTRQTVETEARTALQTIMQNHAQQLQQVLPQYNVERPDPRLLQTGDPEHQRLYFAQMGEYEAASAQREQITQQMSEAQRYAAAIAQQQEEVELQAEHQLLEEKLGQEWSDPSSRAKLLGDLGPIAAELGYPQELIANARGVDILAMKHVATLKAKADKYDALQKAKMVPVRAAKSVPPTSRPGSPAGNRQSQDVVSQMYPNDVRN